MKYSIGQFAATLGVTVDTLRLYEKYGIISPIKNSENNYRYFNDLDARNLLTSRWYRSIQIPLQDAAILTQNASLDNIAEKVNETQLNLEAEIKKSTMLLNKIVGINKELKEIKTEINKCKIKAMPGMYRLKQTKGNVLIQEDFLRDLVDTWMNALPYTFFSFRIEKKEIVSLKKAFEYSWGLAIFEDEIGCFDVKMNENVEYISPKVYLSSIILSSQGEHITRDSIQFMMDYIKENNYKITEDIIGKIILTEKINGKNKSYLELNIPIQSHE
ncbi:putative transcriptional regulator, MerR family [Alkaliphilus metalliredigens QYMF]|uniref:Putative transcriptional regulator, MerR family n=1 Tax=Alkaliphilus metalliredigens (strain QYMF) TaxID=293826 RepID=A6TKI7_ALKMQ|nr:MerR family transcriptional regulator [Alkaliphilus metalliredigens]ABR46705.1 putative transcriptional regulator, MerR family [Alkaliphilus metalliredigens QYMF]